MPNEARGRLMAIDYGERRVGLAISDPTGTIASPAGAIVRRAGKRPPVAEILRRAEALEARGFVVGLPLDGNGDETPRSREVRLVAEAIGARSGKPVELVDERYTTATALRGRARDGRIDTRTKGRRRRARRGRVTATGAGSTKVGGQADRWTGGRCRCERLRAGSMRRRALSAAAASLVACGAGHGPNVRVTIPPGASMRVAAESLSHAHVISFARGFRVYASLRGNDRGIRAGTYLFHRNASWSFVLDALRAGKGLVHIVTIPEGFSLAQIESSLETKLGSTHDSIVAAGRDTALLHALDLSDADARGVPLSRHVRLSRRHDAARRGRHDGAPVRADMEAGMDRAPRYDPPFSE